MMRNLPRDTDYSELNTYDWTAQTLETWQ